MFILNYTDADGNENSRLYYTHADAFKDTFSPSVTVNETIMLKLSGRTYNERKRSFKAICKALYRQPLIELAYSEEADILDFIERNAKRYGMIKELESIGMLAR